LELEDWVAVAAADDEVFVEVAFELVLCFVDELEVPGRTRGLRFEVVVAASDELLCEDLLPVTRPNCNFGFDNV